MEENTTAAITDTSVKPMKKKQYCVSAQFSQGEHEAIITYCAAQNMTPSRLVRVLVTNAGIIKEKV